MHPIGWLSLPRLVVFFYFFWSFEVFCHLGLFFFVLVSLLLKGTEPYVFLGRGGVMLVAEL